MKSLLRPLLRQLAPPDPGDPVKQPAQALPAILASTQRELAIFASEQMGAQSFLGQFASRRAAQFDRRLFQEAIESTENACIVIDPRPGLHIVETNAAYAAATMADAARLAGQKLFDAFPDNPDLLEADGVSNLYLSIQRVAQSGRAHMMPIQRYDVRDSQDRFVERHWRCVNIPVFSDDGKLAYILHRAECIEAASDILAA